MSLAARHAEALGAHLPPLLVAADRVAATVAQGVHGRRRVGQGDSFWQFRPFYTGDSAARIDWRMSARANRAFVRETEWEAAQTVCLWRDGGASMRWRSRGAAVDKIDRASLLLLALAALLLRGGERVRLIAPDSRPFAGRTGLDRIADAIERLPDNDGLPPEARLPRQSRAVLIGDLLAPLERIQAAVARLAALPVTGTLLQVLDPAEAVLPYQGRVRFQGVIQAETALIPRVETVRAEYAERLAAQHRPSAGNGVTGLVCLARAANAAIRGAPMIFATPWVLLALAALPLLWWLLRVTPPAPRREVFPAVRLLLGLHAVAETPARTPWWLLLLRVVAAGLLIVGLARPVLDAGTRLPGSGPVLLVIDDGWASAGDWSRRMTAADAVLDRAERAGRPVALLATSPGETAAAPQATVAMPVADLRPRLAALRPKPWPVDRAAAAAALRDWGGKGSVVYLADGLSDGDAWPAFAAALAGAGPLTELRDEVPPARLLLPPRNEAEQLVVRVGQVPRPAATPAAVLAQSSDGRALARLPVMIGAGEAVGEAPLRLPLELRNRVAALTLEGQASAGSVVLLDERWRRRPVGILAGDAATADTQLTGQAFFLRRALDPYTEVREGDLDALLSRDVSVLMLADHVVADGPERDRLAAWVDKGGLLVRFAGPETAAHPDGLLPVKLLEGDRQLGGALSWSKPAGLAEFPAGSPFAGLPVPAEVRVTEQVLAEPGAHLAEQTWARLADGTPLVTAAPQGAGRIVLFHVTANADWSDLPLSGLFVDMLRRLVALSAGVATEVPGGPPLAPAELVDGFGQMVAPPSSATALPAADIAATAASPRHPPGLYGPENGRRALNLSAHVAAPVAAPAVSGAAAAPIAGAAPERAIGPWLIALALALLVVDLLVSLRLRGLLRAAAAMLALCVLAGAPQAQETEQNPALITRLAYVVTGDDQLDGVSRMGLAGLSDYVNHRTAATLGEPAPVTPGQDDLSFYPLLYWPISADAAAPSGAAVAALNSFMAHGGIILIDTRGGDEGGGGTGAGFAPGAAAALERFSHGLAVPPLAPLTSAHVLARAFYLLQDFPGRYDGDTVWVQRDQDRSNDSVSPVIIGAHDWAAAWAVDGNGRTPFATLPGGDRQRTLAYRFGVNLVMYALTGNYKGDQVHVPSLLERLGQ
jgi:hypothetical protein